MPRKAAASADSAEPRRSTRIKDLPKPDLPKKAPVKPRAKKAEAPKRGKKRSAEEANGDEPAAKKAKPASNAADKPASKPTSNAASKPVSKAKPASKVSAKPASRASVKPASRAGSKKPVSKAEVTEKTDTAHVPETITEETESAA